MMRIFAFILLLSGIASAATYRGQNIDGKEYTAATRINGSAVTVSVQFAGKTVSVLIDGKAVEMELESEEIKDPTAIRAHDGKQELVLNILDLDC